MINKKDVFISCDATYKQANIVMFGADFDGTVSYRPGARFGPYHIRKASYGLESYSMALERDLGELSIFDAADLECVMGDVAKAHKQIYDFTKKVVADKKTPMMIGGEHSCTYPSFKAVFETYPDLMMIQIDAHADLREDYLGLKESHASVMHRVTCLADNNLKQIGIRSSTQAEHDYMKKNDTLLKTKDEIMSFVKQLNDQPVYISLDLDVLDPSLFCGTGTPEPNGFSFDYLMEILNILFKANVIAMDVMECAPDYDSSQASSVVGAKVVREMLLLCGGRNGK